MTTPNRELDSDPADSTRPQITRVASYGIVQEDSRILLCRLSEQVPSRMGWWTLPGGGVDFGEHPEEGMIREVLEETGYHVQSTGLLGIDSITRDRASGSFHGIRIIYSAKIEGGSMENETNGTTDKCEWHPIDAIGTLQVVELVEEALILLQEHGA